MIQTVTASAATETRQDFKIDIQCKHAIKTARPCRDIDHGKILENIPTMFTQFEIV